MGLVVPSGPVAEAMAADAGGVCGGTVYRKQNTVMIALVRIAAMMVIPNVLALMVVWDAIEKSRWLQLHRIR